MKIMSDMKKYIEIIQSSNDTDFDIVNEITKFNSNELSRLIEHMDDDMLYEISETLIPDNDLFGVPTRELTLVENKAKDIWISALKGAKNVVSGRTFAKLKGIALKLLDSKQVNNEWALYKSRYNITTNNTYDLYRFFNTTYPQLKEETIQRGFKDAGLDIDKNTTVDDISSVIASVSRSAAEQANDKVMTGQFNNSSNTSTLSSPTTKSSANSTPVTKTVQSSPQETPRKDSTSVERLAYHDLIKQGYSKKQVADAVRKLKNTKNIKDVLSDKSVKDLLAAIGFHQIKR